MYAIRSYYDAKNSPADDRRYGQYDPADAFHDSCCLLHLGIKKIERIMRGKADCPVFMMRSKTDQKTFTKRNSMNFMKMKALVFVFAIAMWAPNAMAQDNSSMEGHNMNNGRNNFV